MKLMYASMITTCWAARSTSLSIPDGKRRVYSWGNDSIKNNIKSKLVRYTNINLLIFCTVNTLLLFYHYWYTTIVLINILHLFLFFMVLVHYYKFNHGMYLLRILQLHRSTIQNRSSVCWEWPASCRTPNPARLLKTTLLEEMEKVRNEPQSNYFPPSSMKRHSKSECVLNLHDPTNLHTGICIQK